MRLASRFAMLANQIRRDRPLSLAVVRTGYAMYPVFWGRPAHLPQERYAYIPHHYRPRKICSGKAFSRSSPRQTRVRDSGPPGIHANTCLRLRPEEIKRRTCPRNYSAQLSLTVPPATRCCRVTSGLVCQNGCVCGQSQGRCPHREM